MAPKPKRINKITAKFNVRILPTNESEPGYKGIKKMMQLLYTNTETLPIPVQLVI